MVGVAEPKAIYSISSIYLYNGERGMKLKYFFYWVYPVHLLVLGLIR
ncbi:MAG: TraX family protein [Coprococcus sp.]